MNYIFCHECKEERQARFEYDPIDNTFITTCYVCSAAWCFETQGAYQVKGPLEIERSEDDADIRD